VSCVVKIDPAMPTAIIPCRNEAASIVEVIADLRRIGIERIVIGLDPLSTDQTAELAADHGAVVVWAKATGYDSPCISAVDHLRAEQFAGRLLFLDAGNKYEIDSIGELLARADPSADITFGVRDASMRWHQRLGNTGFKAILRARYGQPVLDVSSVRLLSIGLFTELRLEDRQFSLPFQTIVHALASKKTIHYVPIRCRPTRTGTSKVSGSKRNSVKAARQMVTSLLSVPDFPE
jgi:glycosyltransferase involved in cell wall biosynthesis